MRIFFITMTIVLFATPAFAEDDYATLFAAGMQNYAEGQHEEALMFLYRAYAHKPNSTVLALIVRTHDFMGHCSAAERQRDLFSSLYPKKTLPKPQHCERSGTLEIACSTRGYVFVDENLEVQCGQSIKVPAGEHRVFSGGTPLAVKVDRNAKTSIQIVEPIEKLPLEYEMQLKPTGVTSNERKPKFKIWVRTNLRDDPDMNAESEVPGFEVYQDADGLFHVFSDSLKPVRSKERKWND